MSTAKTKRKKAKRKRLERCPFCDGCGEVLGWVTKIQEVDWIECGFCRGEGYMKL